MTEIAVQRIKNRCKKLSNGWEKYVKIVYFLSPPYVHMLEAVEIYSEKYFRECRKVYDFSILSLKKALKSYTFLPSLYGRPESIRFVYDK